MPEDDMRHITPAEKARDRAAVAKANKDYPPKKQVAPTKMPPKPTPKTLAPPVKPLAPKPAPMQPMAVPQSFKKGGVVKKSGWATLHKGERVIPAGKAKNWGK